MHLRTKTEQVESRAEKYLWWLLPILAFARKPAHNKKLLPLFIGIGFLVTSVKSLSISGDPGTSVIYTVQAAMAMLVQINPHTHKTFVSHEDVIGSCSAILLSLLVVGFVLYLNVLMKVHKENRGGIAVLLFMVLDDMNRLGISTSLVERVGFFGVAALGADGVYTAPTSIVSAVEGFNLPIFLTLLISLLILWCIIVLPQRWGTAKIGVFFGPWILWWFVWIGFFGYRSIAQTPEALEALNLLNGVEFIFRHPLVGGVLVLCITGFEAYWADREFFGQWPIFVGFVVFALPNLFLCYIGEAAYVLRTGDYGNPFFGMFPSVGWITAGTFIVTTGATIIASQALYSASMSMVNSLMLVGSFVKMKVVHPDPNDHHQVYVPVVCFGLGVANSLVILGYQHSLAMIDCYGASVVLTMSISLSLYLLWKLLKPFKVWFKVGLLILISPEAALLGYYVWTQIPKLGHGALITMIIALSLCCVMVVCYRKSKTGHYGRVIQKSIVLVQKLGFMQAPAMFVLDVVAGPIPSPVDTLYFKQRAIPAPAQILLLPEKATPMVRVPEIVILKGGVEMISMPRQEDFSYIEMLRKRDPASLTVGELATVSASRGEKYLMIMEIRALVHERYPGLEDQVIPRIVDAVDGEVAKRTQLPPGLLMALLTHHFVSADAMVKVIRTMIQE